MEREQRGVLDTLIGQTGKVQVEHLITVPVSVIVSVIAGALLVTVFKNLSK